MALKLPRNVIPKTLAGGQQAFYYNVPTHFRKLGCPIPNEALGDYITACGTDGEGGRAAVLNALFDKWNQDRKGVIYAKASIARVGSLDWLFREFKQTKAYLEKVSKRSRPGYEHSMQAICDVRNKKGERIGSLPIESITPRAADKLYEIFIKNGAGESVLFRRWEKFVGLCRKAWRVVHRLYPAEFAKDIPNPWPGVTMKTRTKATKHAVTREQVYTFAQGCVERGEVGAVQLPSSALNGCSALKTSWQGTSSGRATGRPPRRPSRLSITKLAQGSTTRLKTYSTTARLSHSIWRQRRSWRI
ncbi:hypothetical protein [Bradyrhizobium sp. HKCCYLS20291]|uniref:hypothetical protein n=1 Tax=Bradyrhizobium sp. HKCCYLS20291 TaxID=3420766 RepID=UPI003EC0624A